MAGVRTAGQPEIGISRAYEAGFDNVQVQFNCDEGIGLQAKAAMEVMMRYLLTERYAEQGAVANGGEE